MGEIGKLNNTGEQSISVNYKNENIEYNVNLIVYNGNLILDGINEVEGAILSNNTYEFGDKTRDVATEIENAKNMVILKVNGDLTINKGITLTSCKSDDGYGGSKGMLIYCTGTLKNQGTISMTARGAKAEGENVYLWKNLDGNYEYVPAVGATGGESKVAKANQSLNGNDGNKGEGRQTGGRWIWRSCWRRW